MLIPTSSSTSKEGLRSDRAEVPKIILTKPILHSGALSLAFLEYRMASYMLPKDVNLFNKPADRVTGM